MVRVMTLPLCESDAVQRIVHSCKKLFYCIKDYLSLDEVNIS